jgi:hypothetical protein
VAKLRAHRPPTGPRTKVAHANRTARSKFAHAIRDSGPSLYRPAAIQRVDILCPSFKCNTPYSVYKPRTDRPVKQAYSGARSVFSFTHVDEMILFSGDGDFQSLVEAVQRRGVRVTVVSPFVCQPATIADELRLQADEFNDLKQLESKIGRSVSAIREAGRGLAQPRTKQSKSSYYIHRHALKSAQREFWRADQRRALARGHRPCLIRFLAYPEPGHIQCR